jgi:ribonucleoside-diphosphate reductase subunit M2
MFLLFTVCCRSNFIGKKFIILIVGEAVEIETKFVCEALPCALISTNATLMSEYIKFVSDCLLVFLH